MATATLSTTTQSQSTGLTKEEKYKEAISKVYNETEAKSYAFYLDRLNSAREQRNSPNRYFDGLTYIQDYIANENAKNTYLRPKLNDSEVRVNTGTTEKKIEAVHNELIALNLRQTIRAFDQDNLEISELGDDLSDLVNQTNYFERDEDFWIEAVTELLTQRAVFVEEMYSTTKAKTGRFMQNCVNKRLVSGLKMFLGDMTIPAYLFDMQPYIIKYDLVNRKVADFLFSQFPAYKHVTAMGQTNLNEYLGGAFQYRFADKKPGYVEVITYESLPDNEFQQIVDGVMMYAPGTELPWGYNSYNIRMFTLKSLSTDFAYGRPLTASAKTLQALSNEMIRLLVRKFQQAIEPPLAVPKGKIYSRDIWNPGNITQGIRANDFERLINHQGVTDSEYKMVDFIESKVAEFVGASDITQGLQGGKTITATHVLTLQRQAAKMLGLAVYAVSRMKRDLTEIRIYSVFENNLKPTGKRVNAFTQEIEETYRKFSINDTVLEDGNRGQKVIQFTNKDLTEEEQQMVYDHEEKLAKVGKNVRFKFINVNKIRDTMMNFQIIVSPEEREGTALDKIMFQDKMAQAVPIAKISGQPLNGARIVNDFERTWKAKDWFQKPAPGQQQLQSMDPNNPNQDPAEMDQNKMQAEEMMKGLQALSNGSNQGAQVIRGLSKGGTTKPTVNSTVGQAA